MVRCTKTIQVSLQEDGFCISTGPHDSSVAYPFPVKPFAPVILNSPVVLHLYRPQLFPGQVLKIHTEHLGYFLALQNVPQITQEYESVLFQGLCKTFTPERVIPLYQKALAEHVSFSEDQRTTEREQRDAELYTCVFGTGSTDPRKTKQIVSLIRELLELFDLKELCDEVVYKPGEEPDHLLFLYLIQLLAIYVSRSIPDRSLATIMSVASAPFLEANFCNPLCAATVLKPMFLPFFDNVRRSDLTRGEYEGMRYGLFRGYAIDDSGTDTDPSLETITWSESSLKARIQLPKLRERGRSKLWFVAPQFGDRMDMVSQDGQRLMGGQTGEKPLKICEYLISDHLLAYVQCAVFGTVSNMLPCDLNSEFTEDVMNAIDNSMSRCSQEFARQSSYLMKEQRALAGNCLDITGVGFFGQDTGNTLQFGKVFTGPDEKRPPVDASKNGVFTSVAFGVSDNTLVRSMLDTALATSSESAKLTGILSTHHKPVTIHKTISDMYFFGCYHHVFNSGECTEICCVKLLTDPNFKAQIHSESLKKDSKYQLTFRHGALPMCTLTLAMTIRQSAIMVTGLLCAELARTIYKSRTVTDHALSKAVTTLKMAGKFRQEDKLSTNLFDAHYGENLKLTGPAFTRPSKTGINLGALGRMEWFQGNDTSLPSYITNAVNKIGDVRLAVQTIMQENSLSYNRVLFMGPFGKMTFKTFFTHLEYAIYAPMMANACIRTFAGPAVTGGVKLSKMGCYYPVQVYSNTCINTKLLDSGKSLDLHVNATTTEIVEKIREYVSGVKPRIDISRIRMMAPDLNKDQFEGLICTLEKEANITVVGERTFAPQSLRAKRPKRPHGDEDDDDDGEDVLSDADVRMSLAENRWPPFGKWRPLDSPPLEPAVGTPFVLNADTLKPSGLQNNAAAAAAAAAADGAQKDASVNEEELNICEPNDMDSLFDN